MAAPQSLLRRWAIPLATTIPLCAIVFAFSLGPSPRKSANDFLRADAPHPERVARLDAAGAGVVHALAERLLEPGLPRLDEAIAYLGQSGDPRALPALARVCNASSQPPELRKQAFEAALAIDRSRGLALAEDFADRADALGDAARRALETQARSELRP